jgi:hypothetical protein
MEQTWRIRVRTTALTTVTVAAALAAAACTSTQPGQAAPPNETTSATNPASQSPTTSGLAGLNACGLLTDAEAQQAAPGAPGHTDQGELGGGDTSNCQWNTHATNDSGGVTFSITVRPTQGLKDVYLRTPNAERSDTTSTAGRQIALVKNNGAGISCFAAIAVGTGRVDINATTLRGATTEQMCSIVSKIDDYVELRLPRS